MLKIKIKEDADLNKLKDFNFQLRYSKYTGEPEYWTCEIDDFTEINVSLKRKKIKILYCETYNVEKIINKIIELVFAGITEYNEEE